MVKNCKKKSLHIYAGENKKEMSAGEMRLSPKWGIFMNQPFSLPITKP